MRLLAVAILIAAAALGWILLGDGGWAALKQWAVFQQREFQNAMAGTIRALRAGEPGALAALLGACFGYGVVHALGPGHGKVVIGGASMASQATAARMVALAVVSSLAQAGTAILAIYGGLWLLGLTSRAVIGVAEAWLIPASYGMIALIGAVLAFRGLRRLWRDTGHAQHAHAHAHHHDHEGACDTCGHAHGPTPEQVADLRGWRDTALLVGSIAIRPCTGAMFVLAIAWQMNLVLAGALAAIAMGVGTAVFTSGVALGGVGLRGALATAAGRSAGLVRGVALAQVAAGGLVALAGATMFAATL